MLWVFFRKIKLYRRYKDMNKERIEMEIQCKICFKNDFRKNPAIFTDKLFGISSFTIPLKYKHIYKATARKVKRGKGGWGPYPVYLVLCFIRKGAADL